MTQVPQREFWRVHLSTAIVLMLVAGGLMGLNLTPNSRFSFTPYRYSPFYGWPIHCTETLVEGHRENSRLVIESYSYRINPIALVIDISIIVVLLVVTAILSEYFVRCREEK